ncbi:YkvI family membrane protein [Desmospora activa]|uniref:Putative membrane protein YkvI n=1 Tax=Desmospora activa DSM 45169 TaxID=1121389 RepID=A0A2T4Z4R5_9BACL|nr:hypothetical protein [Desmospora activa]PTM56891.1 putative membrane protein YkvI [Desmospora activa DSM 45169]
MHFRLWQSLKLSMTIVGTTIGAGFASGREIWEFFGSYGQSSSWSILLAMVLFLAASMVILFISWKKQTRHYSEVLSHVIGPRMAKGFDGLVVLSLLSSTLVMMAGSGATIQQWSGSFALGVWVMVAAVVLILLFDLRGLLSMNVILIPVMTAVLILVCVKFLSSYGWPTLTASITSPALPSWPSAITYAAFNMLSLLAVLSTLGKQIRHSGEIWVAGILSASLLGMIAFLYNYSLLRVEDLVSQYEIPLFALIHSYSPWWVMAISLILWLAIYTTAVSNVHGLAFRFATVLSLPHWLIGGGILVLLVPLTRLGFANLVTILYPLYGVLNLFILTMILLYPLNRHKQG